MQGICISAMLQSQQVWLPKLSEPVSFKKIAEQSPHKQKFIAHCDEAGNKVNLSTRKPFNSSTILIGPEGDFTKDEIELAIAKSF